VGGPDGWAEKHRGGPPAHWDGKPTDKLEMSTKVCVGFKMQQGQRKGVSGKSKGTRERAYKVSDKKKRPGLRFQTTPSEFTKNAEGRTTVKRRGRKRRTGGKVADAKKTRGDLEIHKKEAGGIGYEGGRGGE